MARDVINLTDDDYEGANRKAAPAGKYTASISPKSEIRKGNAGNYINIQATIKKGEHKGTVFFDTISSAVPWKVAQLMTALGLKKTKSITLQELLKLAKGGELRVILRTEIFDEKKQNKVVQWLPLQAAEDEDEDSDDPPAKRRSRDEDEDEDDDPPVKKRKRDEDEDEDDPPARKSRRDADEDEDDDPPAKRRKKDEDEDEDEDDPPAKRRKRDEDEDDDPPAKKRKKDEDEDEDDPPRRRGKKDEDEDDDPPPARRRR